MAKTLCGILIGARELRAISLKPLRAGFRFKGAAMHRLSPEDSEKPGGALGALLKKVKGAPDKAVLCLPQDQATLRQVSLPSSDPEELKGMVRFEVERHIPFNPERYGVGYQVMRSRGDEGSDVLLAAADGPIIERATAAADEAGIRVGGLNVDSACYVNALLYAEPELSRTKTVALMAIGLDTLELVFMSEGRVLFARSVPHGLRSLIQSWTQTPAGGGAELDDARLGIAAKMIDLAGLSEKQGEEGTRAQKSDAQGLEAARSWTNRLTQELRRSYEFAHRELHCPAVERVVLSGEGAIVRNLDRYLAGVLNLEVTLLNPVASLAGVKLKDLPFEGLEYVAVFGAAIQGTIQDGYRLDLTPPAYYGRLSRRRLFRNAAVSVVFALIASGLSAAAYKKFQTRRTSLAGEYRAAHELLAPQVALLREEGKKLTILEGFLDDPTSALAVLDSVTSFEGVPSRVSIQKIAYFKGDRVTLEGHAVHLDDVTHFAEYLTESGLFEVVDTKRQDLRPVLRGRDSVYVFRIECLIPEFTPAPRRRSAARASTDDVQLPAPSSVSSPVASRAREETSL